ncbi:thiamine biosynthesis protein [Capnocytophaga cynodegmi]|uniref:FAD:protein FMN transferase n=2 Tax=Capnocytophaga cynodegmi TaxID=28189 RepID=A0A250EA39_9FLAO|nr:FAD:protein FMN transferase [Capnocytophaga cynodegmi]ATA68605.1 thiamine biosynthesis protein [Capnocytophaga cynodegmi]
MKKILLYAMLIAVASCVSPTEKIQIIRGEAQGSTYGIKYISNSDKDLQQSVDSILEVIDLSMSTYRPESIISKINRGERVQIDNHFENVFKASQTIWKQSDGVFDPTVGILVNAWGFGANKNQNNLTQTQIDSLKNFVGFNKVQLTDEKFIEKENPAIFFDFNAIAQGYTVDVIADFLKSKGITNFVVEVGGEIYLSGKNTIDDKKWTIGIEDPTLPSDKRELMTTVQFENQGLATSGNYRKIRTDSLTGEKFVHSINPKTGLAKQSNLLSATVITDSAMYADGYATMFMVLGTEASKAFLENHPELNVLLIYNNENNEVLTFATKGFQDLQN